MQLRKLTKSNEGVVGIVVAVLLIGLLVSVVSLLQYMYVPKWMEEREAEHMDQVFTQFAELKSAIDNQIANNLINTPIATSITLGSEKLPFLMSMRAFGTLSVLNNSCNLKIEYGSFPASLEINLGTIRYTSVNAYYIPEEKQSYIYEAGAIITSQTSGSSISIKPSFKFSNDTNNIKNITLKIGNIIEFRDKITYGGYDTIPIQTEFKNTTPYTQYPPVQNITIETSYPKAWYNYLNSALNTSRFVYGKYHDYLIVLEDEYVRIEFKNNYPDLKVYINNIMTQIGPGWIEY
jgi:hypothetical protein